MKTKHMANQPIFFERNRVWRVYLGGALFHDFFGDEREDNNYPEEWIVSNVHALNQSDDPKEGISKVKDTDIYFDDLLKAEHYAMLGERKEFGMLVKALDSAMRLPVQAHPDKAFSLQYFKSGYGKVESWIILATRDDAKIYYGFNKKITEEEFIDAIERNETDKSALEELMHCIPVQTGDVFLVPAKMVHAIGAGCLLLEVQEPTDFTIAPEAWCGDIHISEQQKYLDLPRETALKCFDYDLFGKQAEEFGRMIPRVMIDTDEYQSQMLIDFDDTPCFSVRRHTIKKQMVLKNAPCVFVVTNGNGILQWSQGQAELKKGDYFFLPFSMAEKCTIKADDIELLECIPPRQM